MDSKHISVGAIGVILGVALGAGSALYAQLVAIDPYDVGSTEPQLWEVFQNGRPTHDLETPRSVRRAVNSVEYRGHRLYRSGVPAVEAYYYGAPDRPSIQYKRAAPDYPYEYTPEFPVYEASLLSYNPNWAKEIELRPAAPREMLFTNWTNPFYKRSVNAPEIIEHRLYRSGVPAVVEYYNSGADRPSIQYRQAAPQDYPYEYTPLIY